MKTWWHGWRHALRATLLGIGHQPLAWLANACVVASALSLPLLTHLAVGALTPAARTLAVDPEVSVYLATDASPGDFQEAQALIEEQLTALKREPNGHELSLTVVPKAQALKEFRDQAERAGNASAFAVLKENPLPDGFVIRAPRLSAHEIDQLALQLRAIPKVDMVQVDAQWVRRLGSAVRAISMLEWVLAALFGAVVVAVTFNATHIQVLALRDEIEVARLVGATNTFIQRPFIARGALLGLCGAGLAVAIASGVSIAIVQHLGEGFELTRGADLRAFGACLVASAALGGCGGWWSANRHLRRLA